MTHGPFSSLRSISSDTRVTNELLLGRGIHRRAEIAGSRTVRS